MKNKILSNRWFNPVSFLIFLTVVYLLIVHKMIFTGKIMAHDAINWHGISHFFYSSVAKGIIPYWNPYSQTGTPFFNMFQSVGLLIPSQFLFIAFQKLINCTTITTYILHYMFQYYIFILGTYFLIRLLTKSNKTAFYFSVILMLALFPTIIKQNSANYCFFLIPFIAFFLIKFFEDSKGFYLFILSFLLCVSIYAYMPIWVMFFLLQFIILGFIFKVFKFHVILNFLKSKKGIIWSVLTFIFILLVTVPFFSLYYEFTHNSELFPTLRLIRFLGYFTKCFATDIYGDLFFIAEGFARNTKVSMTLCNIGGLLLEPIRLERLFKVEYSEIVFYISLIPLYCIFASFFKNKNKYKYIFGIIGIFSLFLSCNFSCFHIDSNPTIFQNIIINIFPFLGKSDVLEVGGVLFLLCIVILGSIGFRKVFKFAISKFIFSIFIIIILARIVFVLLFQYLRLIDLSDINMLSLGLSFCILIAAGVFIYKLDVNKIRKIAMIFLFLDMLFFCYMRSRWILEDKYVNFLKDKNVLEAKYEDNFKNYRIPFFTEEKDYPWFKSFFAYEIYAINKVSFPSFFKNLFSHTINKNAQNIDVNKYDFKPFTNMDHFYMTKYYYDYLMNVNIDKQVIVSNMITPIINFFPIENVIFCKDKYEVVNKINNSNIEYLKRHIFIESNRDVIKDNIELARFLEPSNNLTFSKKHVVGFFENLEILKDEANEMMDYSIVNYTVNNLSMDITLLTDGYLYYGDGYSKDWKAFVDGKQVDIKKTNINFKSIYLTKGNHKIEFVFEPKLFKYSLYAYFIGICFFIIVCILYGIFAVKQIKRESFKIKM